MFAPIAQDEIKGTLLVVEDDVHLLSGIRDILELDHYHVMTAQNGREALDLMKGQTPDLIVSDIMMPYMDGIELLAHVRQHAVWSTVPFIFLTAKGERADIHRGRRMGVDDYLVKPFEAEDLIVAVDARLERVRAFKQEAHKGKEGVKRTIVNLLGHELRTPLTLIVGYAELLRDTDLESMSHEELLTFLRGINDGADRLRRLIENFVFLVEFETGDAVDTFHWRVGDIPDLETLITAARDFVFSQHPDYTCRTEISRDLPVIRGDREYLMMVFRELLDNAVKFSASGSTVTIRVNAVGDHICAEVIDEGRGIPADEFDNIWQMFYQINREELEDQGGGSGLAIVDNLVRLHGGEIHVRSQQGQGSTFTVRLPVKQALETPAAPEPASFSA